MALQKVCATYYTICYLLTEVDDIKKRWQEYTEELYKKGLHDPDNNMVWSLEPDILEHKVKWALLLLLLLLLSRFSRVRLFTTPWTTAYQAPPSMGFSGQEYWSGVPWALESIKTKKASGGDGIPAELFQILKEDAGQVPRKYHRERSLASYSPWGCK